MECNECFVHGCIDPEHLVQPDQAERTTGGRTLRDHRKPGLAAELLMRGRQQGHTGGRKEFHIAQIDHQRCRRLLEYESDRLGQIGSGHQIQFTGYGQNHILITPFHDHIEVLGPEATNVVRSHTTTLLRPNLPTRSAEVHQM